MAIAHSKAYDLGKLIHHSDRGVQYASYTYTDMASLNIQKENGMEH